MGTGFRGTFVISWSQTELDGLKAAGMDLLSVGAMWRWTGEAVRVDGPSNVLLLGGPDFGVAEYRKHAARAVRRLVGVALDREDAPGQVEVDEPLFDSGFVVTDGRRTYTVTLIDVGAVPLLMFLDDMPPADTDLWVVHLMLDEHRSSRSSETTGVICFTSGTRILTSQGARAVDELREGDRIQTKDDGAQEILWVGKRRMSGARLYAMPHLRPIRVHAGALGNSEPEDDLLVSPDHRLLLKGSAAVALFNSHEVLVTAKDLINDRDILVDVNLREVTYIHLLLERHQIVWANGVETESFHPANMSLAQIDGDQRQRLLEICPTLESDLHSYGGYARRNLSASEAAILQFDAA